jgi:hypothetical protein
LGKHSDLERVLNSDNRVGAGQPARVVAMWLRSVISKIDVFITVAALTFFIYGWALAGLPNFLEVVAIGCLILISVGVFIWMSTGPADRA